MLVNLMLDAVPEARKAFQLLRKTAQLRFSQRRFSWRLTGRSPSSWRRDRMNVSNYINHATCAAVNMNLPDRWASVLAGVVLAGSAIRGRRVGKMKLLASAELIRRGVT